MDSGLVCDLPHTPHPAYSWQTDAALGWWRQLFAWAAVPSIVLAGTMLAGASPESPSWLARQGRTADAASALRAVQGVSQGAAERWVSAEVALSEQASRGGGGGWGELLRPEHRRSMQICCGLALAQALGGSNAVIYFAATMFAGAGATGSQATGSILVGLCNLAGTFLALRLSDGLGRKPLLLGSFSGMAICMAALAASQLPTVTTAAPMVASTVVSVAVPAFVLVFASAVGPLPYLLYSEVWARRSFSVSATSDIVSSCAVRFLRHLRVQLYSSVDIVALCVTDLCVSCDAPG